jgi:phosphatidylserine/phosphatidylglycerophosphate/cardiolipin synthase-like enzyme
MNRTLLIFSLCLLATLSSRAATTAADNIRIYFSPHGGCTDAIVNEIRQAQKTILVQAYTFTSAPIAEALTKAAKRGVKVAVILDNEQAREQYSEADFLSRSGIRTLIDSEHSIAHNKIIILDDAAVITGSFNFTKSAETSNAENILVIKDKTITEKYTRNWRDHERHSTVYDKATIGASRNHGNFRGKK